MAVSSERGKRLLRRYPILASAPEHERPGIVGAALRHPLLLLLVVGGGLLLLPLYFDCAFALLGVEAEHDAIMKTFKIGAMTLAPVCVAVPLLTSFVMPFFLRRVMEKRGYAVLREEPTKEPTFKSKKK